MKEIIRSEKDSEDRPEQTAHSCMAEKKIRAKNRNHKTRSTVSRVDETLELLLWAVSISVHLLVQSQERQKVMYDAKQQTIVHRGDTFLESVLNKLNIVRD